MNFYEITKQKVLNEEKSFIDAGITAAAKAVKDGHIVGFLTARTNMANHLPLIKAIMIAVALKMTDDFKDFKMNYKRVKNAFKKEFFFFINDSKDIENKFSQYFLPGVDPLTAFKGSTDQKKAYVLKLLSEIYANKFKFFDDEEKNIVTAKQLEKSNPNIKTHDIKEFDEKKLRNKQTKYEKIFLFDVDGTLIDAEATIYIKKADGRKIGMSQEEFAIASANNSIKLDIGDSLDFHEFADRNHLMGLAKQFGDILKNNIIKKMINMNIDISKAKIDGDTFSGMLNGKKINIRKMPSNKYLIEYDGTVSQGMSFVGLLKNLKKYFNKVVTESISDFSEARVLKLGLKHVDKNINSSYRFKNYSIYLNNFNEGNNFAFVKESNPDDRFYLLTERQMNNSDLSSTKMVIKYLESNKEKLVRWDSLKEMIMWLKDNRQLPINESYFRDIMIIED
jgi:hypothetical protein